MRRRELRSNRQETTLQKEPVGHQLRGPGRARSRERPGRPGPPPAIQDRSHPSVQEHSVGPPHREGYPPRPGVHPPVQYRSFRGPHRRGKPCRKFRTRFSMGYHTHAPSNEQVSWLLGLRPSREHALTWRVAWSRLMSPSPPHPFEHPKHGNHGISWVMLRIAGEFVNERGWCSRPWLRYFLRAHD